MSLKVGDIIKAKVNEDVDYGFIVSRQEQSNVKEGLIKANIKVCFFNNPHTIWSYNMDDHKMMKWFVLKSVE